VTEERKGPRADAAAGAIEGFLRSTGLTRDQLVARDGKGGQIVRGDRAPGIVAADGARQRRQPASTFPWPKSMRWGAASASTESLRWVRPLQGIVALLGDKLVPDRSRRAQERRRRPSAIASTIPA
jgi:glycyl-tRNA synthetase beta chain